MRPRTRSGLLLVAALVMVTAAAGYSRQVELVLTDGRRISGELLTETEDSVTIRVAGVESRFPRERIEQVRPLLSPIERFEQERAELDDDDFVARYELARGLLAERTVEAYRLILREAEQILEERPDYEEARLLRRIAASRLETMEREQPEPPRPDERESPDPAAREAPDLPPLLDPEEINLIKVFEIDLDTNPIVLIPRDVIDEVFERYRNEPEFQRFLGRNGQRRFRALSGAEQLAVLFDLRAREFYSDVVVRTEPDTLREFRNLVHRNYAVRYCGACHTDGRAEGLDLITRRTNHEPVVYTNLMILRRTTIGMTPLINPANPSESPLLQYGLPRSDAIRSHPDVRGWRPSFGGPNDPRFIRMAEWMGSLYGETEDYPIEYTPHGLEAAEQAAEEADEEADEVDADEEPE